MMMTMMNLNLKLLLTTNLLKKFRLRVILSRDIIIFQGKKKKDVPTEDDVPKVDPAALAAQEAEKKKKRRARLRAVLWARMYPIIYQMDWRKLKLLSRAAANDQMSEKLGVNMEVNFENKVLTGRM